jgi:CrcB protein
MQHWILVAAGGAAGSMLRYSVQKLLPVQSFPYGTFAANMAGCLLIGCFWALFQKGAISTDGRLLLMTGFCGGFTTFSAFTLESIQLLQTGRSGTFILYSAASIGLGLLATFCGFKMFQ